MNIIEPSYSIEQEVDGDQVLKHLEKAIRVCYKSEDKTSEDSHLKIVRKILSLNHISTIEHYSITVRFICNRGFTHELVRHRIASFSQESTRYCNYSKDKFGSELTFIRPPMWNRWNGEQQAIWRQGMLRTEKSYLEGIKSNMKPQEARGMLPIDIKTEIVMTANLREWRHVLALRTTNAAHPSMQQLMRPLLLDFKKMVPLIYDDIKY